nr:ultraviolet-B receptor UVR8 [Ipomoea batatas]GMC96542.1 ultraviolet-B receptor UVR8 [Ipomoea batatas]GMC98748.1 ultraviolet-B receptor UVR8 [Ipomoea batatas]GMD02444.1 ultraviolet-B receptor UVR8 [Ipomoea batatas]GMD20423.1 ultraviolet-B receptor UVR8 [Ipomoea batatas]
MFSNPTLFSAEKNWVSPTQRYAVVPDENNGNDVNVPENDVKRMRV